MKYYEIYKDIFNGSLKGETQVNFLFGLEENGIIEFWNEHDWEEKEQIGCHIGLFKFTDDEKRLGVSVFFADGKVRSLHNFITVLEDLTEGSIVFKKIFNEMRTIYKKKNNGISMKHMVEIVSLLVELPNKGRNEKEINQVGRTIERIKGISWSM